jgi:hypothetical protein
LNNSDFCISYPESKTTISTLEHAGAGSMDNQPWNNNGLPDFAPPPDHSFCPD